MKFRVLFFYVAFVAVSSVIAIAVNAGADESAANILRSAQRNTAVQEAARKEGNAGPACVNDVRCPDCNVILLSVDSLRADHVGAYGYARNTTPYFDEMAKKGVLFENYFSSSFLTPVSEMSVHTGMYPSATMVTNFDTVLPEDRTTMAQHFTQKGYSTAALLSSPEFDINPALKESFSRGFGRYEYVKTDGDMTQRNSRAYPSSNQLRSEMGRIADKKFFWWVGVGGVHWPYGAQGQNVFADEKYDGVLKNKALIWQEVFENIFSGKQYATNDLVGERDVQYVRDQYDNGVRAFDEFLKSFMHELQKEGLLDRTIIVIQSEHGEDLHEHGYFAHYDILDTQTHTPLLIISPRFDAGCRIASFAGSVDVFPTIADMLEHERLPQFQGKSLAPIMGGSEHDGVRQEVFLERSPLWEETKGVIPALQKRGIDVGSERHKDIGVRTAKWKYILRMSKDAMEKINWWQAMTGTKIDFPDAELYDLVNDPGETKNVIGQYPNEAAALEQKLRAWFDTISSGSPKNTEIQPTIQPYF